MTTLVEVHEGLKARLSTISGLRAVAFVPDDVPGYPAAIIVPPTIQDYSEDFDEGSYVAVFEIHVLVESALPQHQKMLLQFIDPRSPTSVYQAIMSSQAGRNLGGLNVDAWVAGAPRRLTFDEIAAYKAWGQMVLVMVSIS